MKQAILFLLVLTGIFLVGCTTTQTEAPGETQGQLAVDEDNEIVEELIIEEVEEINDEAKDGVKEEAAELEESTGNDAKETESNENEEEEEEEQESEKIEQVKNQDANVIQLAKNYYRFDKAHYEQSLAEGKIIFLDFHADWCPICKKEQPHIFAAFNELDDSNIVGYKVHFNDGNTNDEDKAAAKKYGITYQHTKVVVGSYGEVSSKSLEGFSKEKVFEVINAAQ